VLLLLTPLYCVFGLAIVRGGQAFATDSGDESPWLYYRWLLGNSLAHCKQAQDAAAAAGGSSGSSSGGSSEAAEDAKAVLGEVSHSCACIHGGTLTQWKHISGLLTGRRAVRAWSRDGSSVAATTAVRVGRWWWHDLHSHRKTLG
jgi:hypothetical protein